MKLAHLSLAEAFGACQLDLQRVSNTASKLIVTVTGNFASGLESGEPLRALISKTERSLELVFNCIGVMQGRRILVELVV